MISYGKKANALELIEEQNRVPEDRRDYNFIKYLRNKYQL
jgi:hypothetical protein